MSFIPNEIHHLKVNNKKSLFQLRAFLIFAFSFKREIESLLPITIGDCGFSFLLQLFSFIYCIYYQLYFP